MPRSERGKWNPDSDSRVEAGQEIKWIYATALPPEEGKPNVEVTLGIPKDFDWLRPDESKAGSYTFELPVNVHAGSETTKMTVRGAVKAASPDAVVFDYMGLEQLPAEHSRAWRDNHDRIADHLADTLCDAVVDQCRTYLAAHRDTAQHA